jgi:uncharacterized membrane protein
MEWKGGRKRRERAQTTPDASFGPQVSIFIFLFVFLVLIDVYKGSNLRDTRYGVERRAEKTRKGPNDAGRVVWALGEFSTFFFVFLILINVYIGSNLRDTRYRVKRRAVRRERAQTTPDASFGP